MKKKFFLIFFLPLLFISSCGRMQSPEKILNQMKNTYKEVRTFHEVTSTRIVNNLKNREESEQETELYFKRPNKFNYSSRTRMISGVAVSDGKEYFLYLSSKNECIKGAAPENISSFYQKTGGKGLVNPSNVVYETFLLDGKFPQKGIGSARLSSSLENVGDIPCYVLDITFPTGEEQKLWISTKDYLIWKNQITITEKALDTVIDQNIPQLQDEKVNREKEAKILLVLTETMKVVEVNNKIPDSKFACKPPEDAEIVSSFSQVKGEKPSESLEGKVAPLFALQDIDGKKVRLADFKGKVVILDFWDSWFKLCAADLKMMQKFHENLGKRNLIILGINEEKDIARKKSFINANRLTFTNLNDTTGEVSKAYGVDKVPRIIIINQDGIIAADYTGFQDEEKIGKVLKKLGID